MRRRKALYLVAVFLLFALIGCGELGVEDDDGPCPNFSCPTIWDDITFTSYGDFEVNNSGSDVCARKIISDCGWHVYNGHNGGYGDTLEVAPPEEEVVLRWAWNDFNWMYLFEGWKGETAEGVKMGDSLRTVRIFYPGLTYYYDNEYKLEKISKDTSTTVYFVFENDVLVEIQIY